MLPVLIFPSSSAVAIAYEPSAAVAAAKAEWDAAHVATGTLPKGNPGTPNPTGTTPPREGMTLAEMKAAAVAQIK